MVLGLPCIAYTAVVVLTDRIFLGSPVSQLTRSGVLLACAIT